MAEDERQYLVGAVSEAQASLSEVAFKLPEGGDAESPRAEGSDQGRA